jgi:S1-C subfamily serine protease
VQRLAKGQPFKRAYLGIVSNPVALPDEIAADQRVGQGVGLMVLSIEDGTPAKQSGLTFGEVILKFGGKSISDSGNLTGLLGEEAIGKPTKLSVLRGGKVVELDITPTTGAEE